MEDRLFNFFIIDACRFRSFVCKPYIW